MKFSLYRFREKLGNKFFSQVLLLFLISSFISPSLYAQEQRRGLFLQDGVGAPGPGESFRPVEGGEEGVFGGAGETDTTGMPVGRRRAFPTGAMAYQVHVLGEVERPGTYRVSPSMRVTDALLSAGGLAPNGSQRFIELRKPGQTHGKQLDLFAYRILGELSQNPYLQDNDTIYVPLKMRAVEIEGPVRRPGIYELRDERTLNELVTLAGGFSVGASPKDPIKIIRYRSLEEKEIFEILPNASAMQDFRLEDGDVVVVQHKFLTKHQFDYNLRKLPNDNIFYPAFENKVFVIGAVRGPGAFEFNQYYTMRQYLTVAGGTTPMAKNGKIKLVRVDGTVLKAKHGEFAGVINPGDTIVVPEKSIPTSFYIGLLPTIASLGLSAAALFTR